MIIREDNDKIEIFINDYDDYDKYNHHTTIFTKMYDKDGIFKWLKSDPVYDSYGWCVSDAKSIDEIFKRTLIKYLKSETPNHTDERYTLNEMEDNFNNYTMEEIVEIGKKIKSKYKHSRDIIRPAGFSQWEIQHGLETQIKMCEEENDLHGVDYWTKALKEFKEKIVKLD